MDAAEIDKSWQAVGNVAVRRQGNHGKNPGVKTPLAYAFGRYAF